MTENSGGMIIITEKRNHLQAFKDFAAENGIMIPEPGDNISSTSYLREKTAETGSLSWIRKELLDYIKTRGFPLIIISRRLYKLFLKECLPLKLPEGISLR